MGRSDLYLENFYKKNITLKGDTALLGFTENGKFGLEGDLYDYQLNNWEINSNWNLDKKYDTIISLRCPYFSKDPEKFIEKCFLNLKEGGTAFLEWGYGHHWTNRGFKFKVGWNKDDIQEYEYFAGNYLWSGVWCEDFYKNFEFKKFCKSIKNIGYRNNIKEIIFEETPSVLKLEKINKKYDILYDILTLWDNPIQHSPLLPQCYILLTLRRKK